MRPLASLASSQGQQTDQIWDGSCSGNLVCGIAVRKVASNTGSFCSTRGWRDQQTDQSWRGASDAEDAGLGFDAAGRVPVHCGCLLRLAGKSRDQAAETSSGMAPASAMEILNSFAAARFCGLLLPACKRSEARPQQLHWKLEWLQQRNGDTNLHHG
jgi:hypothetical protein